MDWGLGLVLGSVVVACAIIAYLHRLREGFYGIHDLPGYGVYVTFKDHTWYVSPVEEMPHAREPYVTVLGIFGDHVFGTHEAKTAADARRHIQDLKDGLRAMLQYEHQHGRYAPKRNP